MKNSSEKQVIPRGKFQFRKVKFQLSSRTQNTENDGGHFEHQFTKYEERGPSIQRGRDFEGMTYTVENGSNLALCEQEVGMGSLDTGCTVSITPEARYLTKYVECPTDIYKQPKV
mmetsp:Transcript_17561/g.26104  ORF Transcript_17561/g.26104 Transcript_17561/m.26104 type:complete len:115 (+) Transcript_17561:199-543(+)